MFSKSGPLTAVNWSSNWLSKPFVPMTSKIRSNGSKWPTSRTKLVASRTRRNSSMRSMMRNCRALNDWHRYQLLTSNFCLSHEPPNWVTNNSDDAMTVVIRNMKTVASVQNHISRICQWIHSMGACTGSSGDCRSRCIVQWLDGESMLIHQTSVESVARIDEQTTTFVAEASCCHIVFVVKGSPDWGGLITKIGSVDESHCCGIPLSVDAQVWQMVG